MKLFRYIVLLGIAGISLSLILARQKANFPKENPDLVMRVVNRGGKVMLRWAVTNLEAWELSKHKGFILERANYVAENSFYNQKYFRLAKPAITERNEWPRQKKDRGSFVPAAYKLLFSPDKQQDQDWDEQGEYENNIWIFAHYLADVSAEVAGLMGLGYSDTTARADINYIYRLYSPGVQRIDTAYIVLRKGNIQTIPIAHLDSAYSEGKDASLLWTRVQDSLFAAYYIERSLDSLGPYIRLNEQPYINFDSEDRPDTTGYFDYYDGSLTENQVYWYRLIGITHFGELTPPSAPLQVFTQDLNPPAPPENVSAFYTTQDEVAIRWEYHAPVEENMRFFVLKGSKYDSIQHYSPVDTSGFDSSKREYVDHSPFQRGTYYLVTAVDQQGNASASLPVYVAAIDSVPPIPPIGIRADCDSLGRIEVNWKANLETDIQGYRVFMANDPQHVFSQLTDTLIPYPKFSDSVSLNTLTEEIYYKIVAVDSNNNHSDFSDYVRVHLPDTMPPSSPVFHDYRVERSQISLKFLPAKDADIYAHFLLRKMAEESVWDTVKTYFPNQARQNSIEYLDSDLTSGKFYLYRIIAIDDDGNYSRETQQLKLRIPPQKMQFHPQALLISKGTDENSIRLEWDLPNKEAAFVLVYRKENQSGFITYRRLSSDQISFEDRNLIQGFKYQYGIKFETVSGQQSKLVKSKPIQL